MQEIVSSSEGPTKRSLHPAKTPGKNAAEIRRKYARIEESKASGK
ncbi:MAG TPA: hypothetical protein VJ857_04270 [Methanocorpusculum sp.]|nr:hypothetical protein [Methanocorpusculum sp.]HKL97863.1 hypothetical protein [Methanocorpusculum sp.]